MSVAQLEGTVEPEAKALLPVGEDSPDSGCRRALACQQSFG